MTIHFLLTPDTASSLALKRLVAEKKPSLGVMVGTWPELLGLARNAFIMEPLDDAWQERLLRALPLQENAFWSESLSNVPAEADSIASIIGQNLMMLLEGMGPNSTMSQFTNADLSCRVSCRLEDLATLHGNMGHVLPRHLTLVRQILDTADENKLQSIVIYHLSDWPRLNPWQEALITRLNRGIEDVRDSSLAILLDVIPFSFSKLPANNAIQHLQNNLFENSGRKTALDNSVQWLAVRDYLLEIEVAAGMIQQALKDDVTLNYSDIGLLLPAGQTYYGAVAATFSMAGIPLSGLAAATTARDLGREAVSHLLICLDGLAPVMALASLLVCPLMPWDKATGNYLAQKAIGNDFKLKLPDGTPEAHVEMLKLIRTRITTPAQLKRCLKRFPALLSQDDDLKEHREQVRTTCNQLIAMLDGSGETIPWQKLRAGTALQAIPVARQTECTRQGIAVFLEGQEPWRNVRRLYVLGCSDGHYPQKPAGFIIFTDDELEQIRSCCGCKHVASAEQNSLQRLQFRRQLCSVSEHVTFLLPRRDPSGKPLAPSASITFSAALFSGIADAETLVLELDSEAGHAAAIGLPGMVDQAPQAPRSPEPRDLKFETNLLELNKRPDGSLKPESPSRLEKLMVSPLAWLFERLGVEPLDWQPETLDIMSKGTLAHSVFEQLFAPGKPLPESSAIEIQVPVLLEESITKIMPFLNRREWKVERKHLQQDILKAALQWREILHQSGAQPVAVEIELKGELEGIPIHGNADLLLELPHNRMYVVDYKKSTSKDRRKRMEAGYDHQAELYRTMIRTGGLKVPGKAPEGLAEKLITIRDIGKIGTLYYLMNDQTALADTNSWLPGGIGNLEEMQTNAAANAMQLIKERFIQLRQGQIELNIPTDEKEFKDKRGISAYALKGDALVGMWMKG